MSEVATYTEAVRKNYDPTHTTALRNAFAADFRRRFKELAAVVAIGVYQNDCFGLKEKLHTFQMQSPPREAYAFLRSQEKIAAFMKWLEKQVELGILTIQDLDQIGTAIESVWTNKYIYDSYKRGVLRARYEMGQLGMELTPLEMIGGAATLLGLPMHLDRLGLLYTRLFTDLKGITSAMDSQISRILAQGLADGDGPRLLARKLVSTINGTGMGDLGITDTLGRFIPAARRAEILARTEIIRAHHLGTIQEYRNQGLLNIVVKAEWKTAGDDRVCSKCASLEGKVFTLDEIEPMIPQHPQCRCIALPYIEELLKYKIR
jgi:SPP1 gp7 family putative phage head morphogenesis protein